jgi:hypothetical protein
MKKTSIYLEDLDRDRLRRLAAQEGRSQAEIVRLALAVYAEQHVPKRKFAMAGCFEGDGSSIADVPDEELLRGFGSDGDH